MAFREMARRTEAFDVAWDARLRPAAVTEGDAPCIGAFLLRIGHRLHPDCEPNTLDGATYYVTRLFDYHRADTNYDVALRASTVVRHPVRNEVVAACLVGGGGASGDAFSIYNIQVDPGFQGNGVGTAMIQRALATLAAHGVPRLHLWRDDDARAASLYERLGFTPTGAVEECDDAN